MKSAALIFGVIAGLLGAGVLALGDIDSSLAAIAALGPDHDTVARLIAYLVPAIGWLGAGLVLGYPRLGGMVLLLSAAAWAAIAFVVGHGTVFFAAAPFIFAVAAGLVALFARRPAKSIANADRYANTDANRYIGVDGNTGVDDVIFEAVAATTPPRRRNETASPASASPIDSRSPAVLANARRGTEFPASRISPPFQDIVPDDEPTEVPAAIDATYRPVAVEPNFETPIAAGETALSDATTQTGDLPIPVVSSPDDGLAVESGPRSRRPGDWTLPTPPTPTPPPSSRYAADRQATGPLRTEPLAPATLPAGDQRPRGVSALDFGAASDFSARRDGPQGRAEGAGMLAAPASTGRFAGRTDDDETPAFKPDAPQSAPRHGGGLRTVLRLLIAFLFIIVLLGLAAAVYLDYRRGAQSILFGRHAHPASTTASTPPVPAVTAPVAHAAPAIPSPAVHPTPQPAAVRPTPPASPIPSHPVAADKPIAAAPAETAPTPVPLAPTGPTPSAPAPATPPAAAVSPAPAASPPPAVTGAAATAAPLADPVTYCAAVDTLDAPDARYTGPAVPASVASALLVPQSTPANQVHWRCADGVAFACNAHGSSACMPTPTVADMLKYCALHPGASNLPAPNGSWSCSGTRPQIPDDQSWPVDSRGFFPGAWVRVSPVN